MTNKYDSYESELFKYEYPYTWERRNRNYLRKVYDRRKEKEFIIPIVFRLRFYSSDGELISDDIYSPSTHNRIKFPDPEIIPGSIFIGWKFVYKGNEFCITSANYSQLKDAIMSGEDDIKLIAVYEQGLPVAVVDVALVDFSVTGHYKDFPIAIIGIGLVDFSRVE